MSDLSNCALPHLPRVAAELNNVAVLFQEGIMFDDAEEIYREAMKVMLAFKPCHEEQAGNENAEESQRWNTVLSKWMAIAQEKLACNHSVRPKLPVFSPPPIDYHLMPAVCSRALSVDITTDQPMDARKISLLVMHNLATIQLLKGEKEKAKQLFGIAMSFIPRDLEMRAIEGIAAFSVHFNLGMISCEEGRLQESVQKLLNAVNVAETVIGDHKLIAGTLERVGQVFLQNGRMHQAQEMFESAARIMLSSFKERKIVSAKKGRIGNGAIAA